MSIVLFALLHPLTLILTQHRGSTREIVGEKGKRLVVHDEGKFDPASIPLKSWQDFENELWEQVSSTSSFRCQCGLADLSASDRAPISLSARS